MTDSNRSYLPLLIAFVLGLLIGWFVLGWLLAPVQWTNALLQDLRVEDQQAFVVAQAEAFATTQDQATATARLQALGGQNEVAQVAEQVIAQAEKDGNFVLADRVRNMASSIGLTLAPATAATAAPNAGATPTPTAAADKDGGNALVTLLGLLVLGGGIALAAWLLLRSRSARRDDEDPYAYEPLPRDTDGDTISRPGVPIVTQPARPSSSMSGPASQTSRSAKEFSAVYTQGDESFDQSFDIEGPDGSYWGECGMTLSETVQGDPTRATALEVWLFDKSDIRTVTKVLMSDFAYGNQALREKLSSRGDALLLAPNLGFVLDAQTLRLMGKIVELEYDDLQAPARSSIGRLRVQMHVMQQAM